MLKYLLPLGLFTALLILLGVGLTLNPREVPSPLVGKPVPQFSLPTLEDPDKTLSDADLRGQVSLLNVWASWCLTCRAEHPFLMELARRGIVIYGLDYKDSRESALDWTSRLGNPYRATGFDEDGKVAIDWGVYGVPETFVIDKQGIVRYKHIGQLTPRDWEEKIGPLVAYLEKQP